MAQRLLYKTPITPVNTATATRGASEFPAAEDHDHGISASSLPSGSAVTAASSKITLGESPGTAALAAFSIDVAEANLTHNNLGGLTTGDPHTQYALLAGLGGVVSFTAQLKTAAANEATAAGAALLGANCPAVTLTTPYTWEKCTTSDGSQGYRPIWK